MSEDDLTEEQIAAITKKLLAPDTRNWPKVEVRKKRLIPTGLHPVSIRRKTEEQ